MRRCLLLTRNDSRVRNERCGEIRTFRVPLRVALYRGDATHVRAKYRRVLEGAPWKVERGGLSSTWEVYIIKIVEDKGLEERDSNI